MPTGKVAIYLSDQITQLEQLAVSKFGISHSEMMQRAGQAAFEFLKHRWPRTKRLTVFCGGGNNGGDGYVVASLAASYGMRVTVWQVGNHEHLSREAQYAREACIDANVRLRKFDATVSIDNPDLIVDAICGIGLKKDLREEAELAVKKMSEVHVPIFSIDVPSGIDADTGKILGEAVHADATITFMGLKLGLLTGHGVGYTGELVYCDLELPTDLFSLVPPVAEKIQINNYRHYLKPRSRDWHKGLSGHVLVIGGMPGFSGAARMAAEAALRVGAGLATIATHPLHAGVMNVDCPEIMCHAIEREATLLPLIERANVIILGPGLGQSEWSRMMWQSAINTSKPLIVDADGLNLLAEKKQHADNWILTPHPGEAARMISVSASTIQDDRLSAIRELQKQYGGVVVLKGPGSLVLASNSLPGLCDKGNPGMASAGMGDVLSGVIGGFVGQGLPLEDAAKLGVLTHAIAGDLAAKNGERGLMAMDLMPYLRELSNFSNHV